MIPRFVPSPVENNQERIRIIRSAKPPILDKSGIPALAKLSNRLRTSPAMPLRSKDFSSDVYGHNDVKTTLLQSQHGKCAFCEEKIMHVSYGHVEHFRPKAGFKQHQQDDLQRPGYYWLAYKCENLLFSCELCNCRHKGNLFPLLNPAHRATTPESDNNVEQPFFIDPASHEPTDFIRFVKHMPVSKHNNRRGRYTIDALGLRRQPLNEHREAYLSIIRELWVSTALLKLQPRASKIESQILRNEVRLRSALHPSAEYSAMARDYLGNVGFPAS